MSKRLIMLVLALAMVACFSAAAYAEVQNIKVSGDLLMQAITRDNFALSEDMKYKNAGIISHARIRVDADLTDNVSATVRLLNERSWGNDGWNSNFGWLPNTAVLGNVPGASDNTGDRIELDLAYATLKEFFYAPVSITVGRQEMRFGSGLVVADVDTNWLANEWQVPYDLSLRKSFDAARLNIVYEPVVIDAIYSKIYEDDLWWQRVGPAAVARQLEKRDTDLYGLNLRYDMAGLGFKGTTELYWFSRVSKWNNGVQGLGTWGLDEGKTDVCQTIGFLTQGKIIKNLTASLEGAYQFGADAGAGFVPNQNKVNARRSAWAMEFTANYNLQDVAVVGKYAPQVGGVYGILSGDKSNPWTQNGDNLQRGWDPMFEDKTLNSVVNAIFPNTNVRYAGLLASCKPIEDVTLSGVYGYYWFDRTVAGGAIAGLDPSVFGGSLPTLFGAGNAGSGLIPYSINGDRHMGQAFDLTGTYDYTEDVQFGLTYGIFFPGKALDRTGNAGTAFGPSYKFDDSASQIIGSMKVTF